MEVTLTKEQFKKIRLTLLMTQKEFADFLGISEGTVQKKEYGTRAITSRDEIALKDYMKKRK